MGKRKPEDDTEVDVSWLRPVVEQAIRAFREDPRYAIDMVLDGDPDPFKRAHRKQGRVRQAYFALTGRNTVPQGWTCKDVMWTIRELGERK